MGSLAQFRYNRALPQVSSPGDRTFFRYNVTPLRQLATLAGTSTAGAGLEAVMSVWIPASSWLYGKRVLMRGRVTMITPLVGLPPTYNVTEQIVPSQGPAATLPIGLPYVPITGTFSTIRVVEIIRLDPYLDVGDQGDCFVHNFMNSNDNQYHSIQLTPGAGSYDFTQEIRIDLSMSLPITIPGANVFCDWCEGFIEQGTNLGKL